MDNKLSFEDFINLPLTPENNREFKYYAEWGRNLTGNPWVVNLENKIKDICRKKDFKDRNPFEIKTESLNLIFSDPLYFDIHHRFSKDFKVPIIEPILTIDGLSILTRGNLSAITGKPKTGKSMFLVYNILRNFLNQKDNQTSIQVFPKKEWYEGVIYIDTEQSSGTFYQRFDKLIKVCEMTGPPDWLHAYNLRIFDPLMLLRLTQSIFFDSYLKSNGLIWAVVDGIGDFSSEGLNEESESYRIVKFIEQLALIYNCHITLVIHKNKTSDTTRGFLGSQLERKLEASFDVRQEDNGQFIVVPELLRNVGFCPSLRYQFNDFGIPQFKSLDYPPGFKRKMNFIENILPKGKALSKKEVLLKITELQKVKERRAKDILEDLITAGKITEDKENDLYRLAEIPKLVSDRKSIEDGYMPATG